MLDSKIDRIPEKSPKYASRIMGNGMENNMISGCTFSDALTAIENGDFKLSDILRTQSDAGVTDELEISLDLSILNSPVEALKRNRCIPGVIEPTLPDWIELLSKVYHKVKAASEKQLSLKLKTKCIASLEIKLKKAQSEFSKKCLPKVKPEFKDECKKTDRFSFSKIDP